ncbi:unnamed protein product [Lepeophtheirus salmonis]|uniref:(salmon louse) hypothetical protein n=1 Tax=Lepeophtheirus salmonis TaxID=72036 RepID=A0A7R8HAD9_LEPSM|nr:unnamed protein product [Lepeophtheirus salmonis]CAF2970360.1 unnamed protein product [Lepeophtheirus salmonis]
MDDLTDIIICDSISSLEYSEDELLRAVQDDEARHVATEAAKSGNWSSILDKMYFQKQTCSQWKTTYFSDVFDCLSTFALADVWKSVHIDYVQFKQKNILVLKWIKKIWAAVMPKTSTDYTMKRLLIWFLRFGFLKSFHSYNGTQFTNPLFKSKLEEWGISHSLSPLYNLQSYGHAERVVRIVKEMWKRTQKFLSMYSSSHTVQHLSTGGKTPAQTDALSSNTFSY